MQEFIHVFYMTICILKSKTNFTSTIPWVINISHLYFCYIQYKSRGSCTVCLINIPLRLWHSDIFCFSCNNTKSRYTLISWLNMQCCFIWNIRYLITSTTYYNSTTSIELSAKVSILTSHDIWSFCHINCSSKLLYRGSSYGIKFWSIKFKEHSILIIKQSTTNSTIRPTINIVRNDSIWNSSACCHGQIITKGKFSKTFYLKRTIKCSIIWTFNSNKITSSKTMWIYGRCCCNRCCSWCILYSDNTVHGCMIFTIIIICSCCYWCCIPSNRTWICAIICYTSCYWITISRGLFRFYPEWMSRCIYFKY